MKHASLRAALAVGVLALASPAAAGWQYTAWGMTPAAAQTAAPGKLAASGDARCELRTVAPVEIAGISFDRVDLCFEDGKLAKVEMRSATSYEQVEATLVGALGAPALRQDRGVRSAVFNDTKNDNTIRLVDADLFRILIYTQKPSGF